MKTKTSLIRFAPLLALALIALPAARATENLTLQAVAEKPAALPLTTAFEKGEPGENGGHFVLKLKNTSHEALKLNASIIWSVASHNRANTINLPEHVIEAGAEWKIADLAVGDRVILAAANHEKLEVKVPPSEK